MKTTNHVIYIDGKPYEVGMLTGGSDVGYPSQWDDMLDDLGEDDSLLHCEQMFSLCQDAVEDIEICCVCRGFNLARFWSYCATTYQSVYLGFRPVLKPLVSDTMASEKDGSVFRFGSLYMNGIVIPNPKNPVWIYDLPEYVSGSELYIGDSDPDPDKQIHWIKWRNLLVADRNILSCISWEDLDRMGFTNKVEESKVQTKSIAEDVSLESVRLIDANAYRKVLVEEKSCRPDNDDDVVYGIQMAIDALDDMSTFTWENIRPHGQWIHCQGKSNLWYCSKCGAKIIYNSTRKTYNIEKKPVSEVNKYCRNCGVKMIGEVS